MSGLAEVDVRDGLTRTLLERVERRARCVVKMGPGCPARARRGYNIEIGEKVSGAGQERKRMVYGKVMWFTRSLLGTPAGRKRSVLLLAVVREAWVPRLRPDVLSPGTW